MIFKVLYLWSPRMIYVLFLTLKRSFFFYFLTTFFILDCFFIRAVRQRLEIVLGRLEIERSEIELHKIDMLFSLDYNS